MTGFPLAGSTEVASAARIYDFFLGGKDNYGSDRNAARELAGVLPGYDLACHDSRDFLARAVRFLAAEAGIDQFLDIGAGLPAAGSVHAVARQAAPGARVAYVDRDPVVLVHARAILADSTGTSVIDGDVRSPEPILAAARSVLDFTRPVALMLVAVLHYVADSDRPGEAVRVLADALSPGSGLVIAHGTADGMPAEARHAMESVYAATPTPLTLRSRDDILGLFGGLSPCPPGLVDIASWRPHHACPQPPGAARLRLAYGGIAMKP